MTIAVDDNVDTNTARRFIVSGQIRRATRSGRSPCTECRSRRRALLHALHDLPWRQIASAYNIETPIPGVHHWAIRCSTSFEPGVAAPRDAPGRNLNEIMLRRRKYRVRDTGGCPFQPPVKSSKPAFSILSRRLVGRTLPRRPLEAAAAERSRQVTWTPAARTHPP